MNWLTLCKTGLSEAELHKLLLQFTSELLYTEFGYLKIVSIHNKVAQFILKNRSNLFTKLLTKQKPCDYFRDAFRFRSQFGSTTLFVLVIKYAELNYFGLVPRIRGFLLDLNNWKRLSPWNTALFEPVSTYKSTVCFILVVLNMYEFQV